jgi:hypothetical protein
MLPLGEMERRYQAGMQVAYMQFNSREDQVRGFYELATKAQVTSVPEAVSAVPWKAL